MLSSIKHIIEDLNTKLILKVGLVLTSLMFIVISIMAYKSISKDVAIGGIVGGALFGSVMNIITLIAVQRNNYYTIYIYVVFSAIHAVLNIILSLTYKTLLVLVILQITLTLVAFLHGRKIKDNWESNEYQLEAVMNQNTNPRYENAYTLEE